VCKSCAQFVEANFFSFLKPVPQELSHQVYCISCFDQLVGPQMAVYEETLEKARHVRVYEKNQGKETRLMKRKIPAVQVEDCRDRQETLLRLAFLAAYQGYNGLIDVDIRSEKVIENSYQSTRWRGTGIPTQLRPER